MPSELIYVCNLRLRFFWQRNLIFILVRFLNLLNVCVKIIESKLPHVEILEIKQFFGKQISVPLRKLARLVVRQPIRLDLLFGQVVRVYNRDFLAFQLFRGFVPGMTGNDNSVLVNDDGLLSAELFNRRGDSINRSVILARVLLVWPDFRQLDALDLHNFASLHILLNQHKQRRSHSASLLRCVPICAGGKAQIPPKQKP